MDAFSQVAKSINDLMASLYNQTERQQELVLPSYLTTLNCNVITSVFRTVSSEKIERVFPDNLVQPYLTIEFSEPGPPLIINYNAYPAFSGNETEAVTISTIQEAAKFWNIDLTGGGQYTHDDQEWWDNLAFLNNKIGVQLTNDLIVAMRNARQGTQAVHNFIPKPGIFLSAPVNTTSAITTPGEEPGGEVPIEGPGGGDFPEEPKSIGEEPMMELPEGEPGFEGGIPPEA